METRPMLSGFEFDRVDVSAATALASVAWAWDRFGQRCCVLASMQDAVLIDLAMQVDRRVPIVFLDTGYHFTETWETLRAVERRYRIDVHVVGPRLSPRPDVQPGECCDDKVTLLETALAGRDAWISGIRRSENDNRSATALIDTDRRGKVKVSPLAQWSASDRTSYVAANNVIMHPLLSEGYTSIGCAPCTTRPDDGPRSGRWAGTERTECGLHL